MSSVSVSVEGPIATPYTAVWLCNIPSEKKWLMEIFGAYLGDHVDESAARSTVYPHAILFDKFLNRHDPAYYRRYRGLDAILVDLRDENYDSTPETYANFRGIIRSHWSDVYRRETVKFLPLGYTANFVLPQGPVKKASERQYLWSFVGQVNKSSRPDMVHELARVEPHLLFTTDDMPGMLMWNQGVDGPRRYNREANAAVLEDSIFAPSPMGNVNLECFRVYEALESGSIPIIEKRLTLDYFRAALGDHPMPTVRSWAEARHLIGALLRTPGELDRLQERCTNWWRSYKQTYIAELGSFLHQVSSFEGMRTPGDFVLPRYHSAGWKARELLRHHDARAAWRRTTLMAGRVLGGKGLRVAHSAK